MRTFCQVKQTGHTNKNTVWFHLYELTSVAKFIERESRIVFARGWKEGEIGELLFNGYNFSFIDENILETGCTTMSMHLPICLKVVKMINFMLC